MLVRNTVSWLIMVFGSGNLSMKCVETCTASWARYYFHLFPSFWAFKTYPACKSTPYVHHYIQYKDTTHHTTRLPVPMQYACWSTLMSRLGNIEMVCLYYVYLMFVVVLERSIFKVRMLVVRTSNSIFLGDCLGRFEVWFLCSRFVTTLLIFG